MSRPLKPQEAARAYGAKEAKRKAQERRDRDGAKPSRAKPEGWREREAQAELERAGQTTIFDWLLRMEVL